MAQKTRLNVNIDGDLKKEAGAVLAAIGLDYTTAVTVYLKKVVRERKIPFELTADGWYTVEEVAGTDWQMNLGTIEDEWE